MRSEGPGEESSTSESEREYGPWAKRSSVRTSESLAPSPSRLGAPGACGKAKLVNRASKASVSSRTFHAGTNRELLANTAARATSIILVFIRSRHQTSTGS